MQAHRPAGTPSRLRWLVGLLSCVLLVSLIATMRSAQLPKHSRSVVAVAVSTVEAPHDARHACDAAVCAAAVDAAALRIATDTPDSSKDVISRTAETPQIRGPPEQALV